MSSSLAPVFNLSRIFQTTENLNRPFAPLTQAAKDAKVTQRKPDIKVVSFSLRPFFAPFAALR